MRPIYASDRPRRREREKARPDRPETAAPRPPKGRAPDPLLTMIRRKRDR
ncbi:MAG: hypothetical protein H6807_11635 [Planctomycetes bacterium]|nr:hypothetical protein [Planctomycetota bacterium]